MWFIIKEGKKGLEHPQPESVGLVYTQKNHQTFPASTGTPKYLLLRTTTSARPLPSITADTLQLPYEIFVVELLVILIFGALGLGAAPADAPASAARSR